MVHAERRIGRHRWWGGVAGGVRALVALIDEYGCEIEHDLFVYYRLNLLDFFRDLYGWPQLYRLLSRLPTDSHYQAARAMDRRLAEAILAQRGEDEKNGVEPTPTPLSPQGFTQGIYLQMATVEAIRVLTATVRAALGDKSPPPLPLERPVTAIQLVERERDSEHVLDVLRRHGVKGI
ncbi:hypothetical protein FNU77_08635 [Prescottella equi]|uniref:hypothetical protein n=1 Tax=Rhodococcus hoagii TaxID=43767 RepID=UPI001161EA98|nr:hypothetical protein [Prescottella equi]QDP09776.1 hypothetical protein FNU77_08635 [Prescottella equi]